MQLSSIIFDMDGVLIDSEPVHTLAKKRAFERFGISLPEDVYEKYKGRPDDTMILVGSTPAEICGRLTFSCRKLPLKNGLH